ncbi:MAG: 4-(cytidine 5'-diphospho)-2-C-methyl-D-erythritol kinase [Clostridia bacterium]|nr:4-(cytidine 5'-diphospho)-2-C-methyl-D-erythritol kinase [Clostridia bacterium]
MIVKSNAKINLTLDIKGKRPDGYHLIDSVFQSISLFDEVEIEKSENISVNFINASVSGRDSIAYKAAIAFFEYTNISGGAKITVTSHIPTSSGMGGGSSDCAAVLVGLNKLYDAKLDTETLCHIGEKLGADVPFLIMGGTARVKGIGEIIEPLSSLPPLDLVILKYGTKLSTKDMYEKADGNSKSCDKTDDMVSAIKSGDKNKILNCISNDFSLVSDTKFEEKLLKDLGAVKVGLSGSGPSVFGVFSDFEASALAYKSLSDLGYNVFCAKTCDYSVKIE